MNAPEQKIVDQLAAAGYAPETIISYLEARVEREWENADFQECGNGEKMVFGVCRKVGGTPEVDPATGKPKKPKEEDLKTSQEKKLEAAAKAQGSSADNNKKVLIDGKAYGWAIQNGKPIMIEWGKVAGIKKVGPKKAKGEGRRSSRGGQQSRASIEARIKAQEANLAKQVNEAGRQAIQKQIDELKAQLRG